MRTLSKIITSLFFLICSIKSSYASSDSGGKEIDSCRQYYLSSIQSEFSLGHYSTVDSLYLAYRRSYCYLNNQVITINILKIIREQRLADNYRISEANDLKKEIDSIVGIVNSYFKFRAGITGAYNISNGGPPGWSSGFTFGYHPRKIYGLSWALDCFVGYQRFPFIFNITSTKDKNDHYYEDGYVFYTKGHTSFYNVSVIGSLNKEPVYSGYNDYTSKSIPKRKTGLGFIFGLEYNMVNSAHVKKYYHEYDYVDSSYYQTPNLQYSVVKFKSYTDTDFKTDTLFKNENTINILLGFNLYLQTSKRFLFTFSPYTSLSLVKFSLTDVNYKKTINFIEFKLGVSYLFNLKKNK